MNFFLVVDQGLFDRMKMEMKWFSFVEELNDFIAKFVKAWKENITTRENKMRSEGKWDEDFIEWLNRNAIEKVKGNEVSVLLTEEAWMQWRYWHPKGLQVLYLICISMCSCIDVSFFVADRLLVKYM